MRETTADRDGPTPLHSAAFLGRAKVVAGRVGRCLRTSSSCCCSAA